VSDYAGSVLVSSAGRRVQLVRYFQRALADLGIRGKLITTDMNPDWSAASRLSDAAFKAPKVSSPEYASFLTALVKREGVRLIIPTNDLELLVLCGLRDELQSLGCTAVVSDIDLVRISRDKRKSNEWFRTIGCEPPRALDKNALTYPCFVKPFDGSMSMGARALLSPASVSADVMTDARLMFLEYLAPSQFDEYTIDAYYDRGGVLRCFVPRKRLEVRSGEISKGIALRGKTYDYLAPRLARVTGARGCLTFQFFASKAEDRWVASELNARFGGGIPLTYGAGANYPEWLLREYILGDRVEDFDGWKDRTAMVRYDDDVIFEAEAPA
jgi:carbamoyl-phosphate synthase large subunit